MGFLNGLASVVQALEIPAKEKGKAYAYLIFMGLLGAHEFYLEKVFRGILYILSFIVLAIGFFIDFLGIGTDSAMWCRYIGTALLLVFWLFDFLTLGKQVDKWNSENYHGNIALDAAGTVAGNLINIPYNTALEEYNGFVNNHNDTIQRFEKEKTKVESMLKNLQAARKETIGVVSKMQKVCANIPQKEKEHVIDVLGDVGELSGEITQILEGSEDSSAVLENSINQSSVEMSNTFRAALEWTQVLDSDASKFMAIAETALSLINQAADQAAKIAELKQAEEEILYQQNEVETKIRELEATEERGGEILKAITAEMQGFDFVYNNFCSAVFPNGVTEAKEAKALSVEERKLLMDLATAARNVIATGDQKIN
jgi:TM2 domain-containing membrane protein YozV